jgi:hypothetical protein
LRYGGTGERIDAVLEERNGRREDRTDFIRMAVERELERRERKAGKRRHEALIDATNKYISRTSPERR